MPAERLDQHGQSREYGSYKLTDVFVVVDGFQPPYQTVQFDNTFVRIGSDQTTYTYEKNADRGDDNDKDDKHKHHHGD